jgi:FAD/FMN-containing dehydrogenase
VKQATRVALGQLLGEAGLITEETELHYYAQDVFAQGEALAAVIRPSSRAQLAEALQLLKEAKVDVLVRGGGLSYTNGYLAQQAGAVLIDMRACNEEIDVHADDRYVIVDAGVTWAALAKALAPYKLRTPFFGPLSGLRATVGGALSQGSAFLGSAQHGSVADSVLAMEVLTVDGECLRTGSWTHGEPFFRHMGPDLSGVFVGDAGCLGIKTRVSLKLIPEPAECAYFSLECADCESMIGALTALAQNQLGSELFAFDPVLTQKRMQRASILDDAKTLGQVVMKQGVLEGLKLAVQGRNFVDVNKYSVHMSLEAGDAAGLKLKLNQVRKLALKFGKEIDGAIPRVLRTQPFTPPNSILGPLGERWVPVHGIVAHSKASAAHHALQAFFAASAKACAEHQIEIGYLYTAVGAQGFLIEPVFYWPDARGAFHERELDSVVLARLPKHAPAPKAYEAVCALKKGAAEVLRSHGACHFQLGKFYPYREGRNPAALALFDAIKKQLDPDGRLNPGALH